MLRRWILNQGMTLSSLVGYPVGKAVQFLRKSEYWSVEEMRLHHKKALKALMTHCYNHVPYYRDLLKSRNLTPDDFQSPSDLSKLPYLTKTIIRAEADRLRAENYPDHICQFRRSGGTTGEPIKVATDRRARAFEVAAHLRGLQWMNYTLGRPMVHLFGGSLGLSDNRSLKTRLREWLLNSRFLPAFELTPDNVVNYIAAINQADGGILVGYASAILNLVEYMSQRGFRSSPLSSVICTAESVPDQWRARIREVLGVPVYCYYGCGEVNGLAYECKSEEGYIISQEHVIVEVANNNPTVFNDLGTGETCITTLFNYALPLIRYLNGDVFELQYSKNGHAHLRITKLEGRVMDQLLRTNGTRVSSTLPPHLIFKSGVPVWRYQVVQTERDKIVFHYLVRDSDCLTTEMQATLAGVFRKYLGDVLQIDFVHGDFEISKSGKHRFVINKLLEKMDQAQQGHLS